MFRYVPVPDRNTRLSKRVNVVTAEWFLLIAIPLLSVFWTVRPLMFSVGRAVAVDPTENVYVPVPAFEIDAPVLEAFKVPSIVKVVPAVRRTLPPLVAIVSAAMGWMVKPPEKDCAALPTVYVPALTNTGWAAAVTPK